MAHVQSHQSEPLSPAVFHILLALATTERHGYGIMKQAERNSAGHLHLGPGTLYGTIKRLLAAGYISETENRPDPTLDDQRRRYYRITPAGLAALGVELERYESAVQTAHRLALPQHHKPSTATS